MRYFNLFVVISSLFFVFVDRVELKSSFQSFVDNVAAIYHSDWRKTFLLQNPHARNRFKLTKSATNYKSSDFIYPMILTVGSSLVHRNLKVARSRFNASLIYVDILNMNFAELPSDWAAENRATARVACRLVLKNLREKRLFDRNLIEEMSQRIHQMWIQRNVNQSNPHLLVPYENLSQLEKEKDRKAILVACRFFNEFHLYQTFRTNPIEFIH